MQASRATVLVNGANGKLGRAVIAALDGRPWRAGVRRLSAIYDDPLIIADDGRVSPDDLVEIDAIVNCAGQVRGCAADVHRANVEHAVTLATAARDAGVRRFVQVSSFSVYGAAQAITRNSPLRPNNDYGRSKVAAELALARLATASFSVFVLRLPFMFDVEQPALIGRMVDLFTRLPAVPVAKAPVYRSMLAYGDAAALLVEAVDAPAPDTPVAVADPVPFTFDKLVTAMRHHGLRSPRFIPMPQSVIAIASRMAPVLSRRLFASSLLHADANWAAGKRLPHGIKREMDAVIAVRSGADVR